MSMKILFISPHSLLGGASIANQTIARILIKNGHNVLYNDEYFPKENHLGLKIDHTPYHTSRKELRKKLVEYVKDNNIQIVLWSPAMTIYYLGQIIKLRKIGVKNFSVLHSLSLGGNIKARIIDFVTSITLSFMDTIIFVSRFTLMSWLKFPAIKISNAKKEIVYNSVSLPDKCEIHHELLGGKIKLGFVGRFSEEKHPELFCEISKNTNYELHAWGDGPLLDVLRNDHPRVTFHGIETDLSIIYSSFDILVMTSEFENCPMVILEAKSRGMACVAPNVGGIPEIVNSGEDGELYEQFSPQEVYRSVEKIAKNYTQYSVACLQRSQAYTIDHISTKWNSLV